MAEDFAKLAELYRLNTPGLRSIGYDPELENLLRRMFKAGAASFAAALKEHWLTGVECDHEAKTDTATCYCSVWRSKPMPNIPAAVGEWIEHVKQAAITSSLTP